MVSVTAAPPTISVSHLTGDEIPSPVQFTVKRKKERKQQSLCDKDVRSANYLRT